MGSIFALSVTRRYVCIYINIYTALTELTCGLSMTSGRFVKMASSIKINVMLRIRVKIRVRVSFYFFFYVMHERPF